MKSVTTTVGGTKITESPKGKSEKKIEKSNRETDGKVYRANEWKDLSADEAAIETEKKDT